MLWPYSETSIILSLQGCILQLGLQLIWDKVLNLTMTQSKEDFCNQSEHSFKC